jgi:hypothetical protein
MTRGAAKDSGLVPLQGHQRQRYRGHQPLQGRPKGSPRLAEKRHSPTHVARETDTYWAGHSPVVWMGGRIWMGGDLDGG